MLNLYKIKINMPVNAGTYYVVASGFDEAVALAAGAEERDGGHNGGVDSIEVVGSLASDGNLLLNDTAAKHIASWL